MPGEQVPGIYSPNATADNNTSEFDQERFVELWGVFLSTCQASGIYLSIISVLTVLSNGILLVALYKDPLRHRARHPLTVFIMALSVADLLTGLAVDPLFAYFYFRVSQDNISSTTYNMLLQTGSILSGISINVSFLVIVFLSWAQLFAILYPHKQRRLVTTGRALACVAGIYIYAIVFSFLNMLGVPKKVYHKLDVYVHLTAVQVIVVITYVALYAAYKRHLSRLVPFLERTNARGEARGLEQHKKVQKQLVVVNLLLTACLLCFVFPVTVVWYTNLYLEAQTPVERVRASIISVIVDTTLYMKFLIDPFIYGLRLPKFRQAVVAVFRRRRTSNLMSFAMISKVPLPANQPA